MYFETLRYNFPCCFMTIWGVFLMPISDRSIKNQAMIIIKLVHDCWMCFSVTQVESVDLLIRPKTLEHSQKNCYPLFIHNFMFHSWKYVINYLSTSIHPLSIQLCFINYSSTGFIHKSIVAPISWINKTW